MLVLVSQSAWVLGVAMSMAVCASMLPQTAVGLHDTSSHSHFLLPADLLPAGPAGAGGAACAAHQQRQDPALLRSL